jgi:hypothetical protein
VLFTTASEQSRDKLIHYQYLIQRHAVIFRSRNSTLFVPLGFRQNNNSSSTKWLELGLQINQHTFISEESSNTAHNISLSYYLRDVVVAWMGLNPWKARKESDYQHVSLTRHPRPSLHSPLSSPVGDWNRQ